ncbi:MAG: aminoglycoside phosphotransferase [Rhizobacter sp.]|nr:aminoglycoside phosphotransferase [Rhizobacter sp.]
MSDDSPSGGSIGFDIARLAALVRDRLGAFDGALQVERFNGGQSMPTYGVTAGSRRYVLRARPTGTLLASAHAIDREYRVLTALAGSAVPVPATHLLVEDASLIGCSFYLMDRVDGRIFGDQTLPDLPLAERRPSYDELAKVLAALHRVDWRAAGLADYGRHDQYLERQVARWTRQYRASETGTVDAMDRLIDWLPAHLPPGSETTLVHGDYRLDNVIFHASEPRIVAGLDWELSTLGDPLADLAYHCMTWRLALGTHRTLAGIDPATIGIPTEQEQVATYCRYSGRRPDEVARHWDFYMAFNMFRLAAIQQGVAKRVLAGNAASPRAAAVGERVRATAELGWASAGQVTVDRHDRSARSPAQGGRTD